MHMDRTLPLPMAQTRQEPKPHSADRGARGQSDDFSAVIDGSAGRNAPAAKEPVEHDMAQAEKADADDATNQEIEEQPDIQSVDQTAAAPAAPQQGEIILEAAEISAGVLEEAPQVSIEEMADDAVHAANAANVQTASSIPLDLPRQDEPLVALAQNALPQKRGLAKTATGENESLQSSHSSDEEVEKTESKLSNDIKSATDLTFPNSSEKDVHSEFQDSFQPQTQIGTETENLPLVESAQKFTLNQPAETLPSTAKLKNLATQIFAHIFQSEGGDLDISLSPEELGLVRISFSKGDRTTLVIYAERLDTLDLMRRNSDILQRELRGSGLSEFNLEFHQSDTSSEERGHRSAILTDSTMRPKDSRPDSLSDAYLKRLGPPAGMNTNTQNIDIRL